MKFTSKVMVALALLPSVFATTLAVKRNNGPSGFVKSQNSKFVLDGKPYLFTATNAYWLHQLSDSDIDKTFSSIASKGLKVVTTWAFDDVVDKPPPDSTYFQLFQGDKITINEAGLQRLDSVVNLAEKHGLKLVLSLTGNWFPSTKHTKNPKPHGYLSNSYGGADLYVQQLSGSGFHDDFFTNPTIINAFKNYVRAVVTRYVNSPAVFSWQIIDDPRCDSTLPASPGCNFQTLINWHADIYTFIKSIDGNHLVGTGDTWFWQEYYQNNPGSPSVAEEDSRVPHAKKALRDRSFYGAALEKLKRSFKLSPRVTPQGDYAASQLILGQPGRGGRAYVRDNAEETQRLITLGTKWIDQQADIAAPYGVPIILSGFGLVTKSNAPCYIPRNATEVVQPNFYLPTNAEQGQIYSAWLDETLAKHYGGAVQYQWSESGLGPNPIIFDGNSPNDGYAATPEAVEALQRNAQLQDQATSS